MIIWLDMPLDIKILGSMSLKFADYRPLEASSLFVPVKFCATDRLNDYQSERIELQRKRAKNAPECDLTMTIVLLSCHKGTLYIKCHYPTWNLASDLNSTQIQIQIQLKLILTWQVLRCARSTTRCVEWRNSLQSMPLNVGAEWPDTNPGWES